MAHDRRIVADLANKKNLCSIDPTVKEVLDLVTGHCLQARDVIGSDSHRLMLLRMTIAEIIDTSPLYACPICHVPLRLNCMKDGQPFYFMHIRDEKNCPSNNERGLSKERCLAAKYNGAKESVAHIQMKEMLRQTLIADERFSDIAQEKTWKGTDTTEIRRPDISALFKADAPMKMAFEIQLSTTYLDVIAGRRNFYTREGAFLFWIFKEFDLDAARMAEHDVFHANRCNAFILDEATVRASQAAGRAHFRCVWVEPQLKNGEIAYLSRERMVSIDELRFDQSAQSAFFFDYTSAHDRVRKEQAHLIAKSQREAAIARFAEEYHPEMTAQEMLDILQVILPEFPRHDRKAGYRLEALGKLMMSAKTSRPWGWSYENNVSVFNNAYQYWPELVFFFFCCALKAYSCQLSERPKTPWEKKLTIPQKKRNIMDDLRQQRKSSVYYPDIKLEPFLEAVFPEAYHVYKYLAYGSSS